MRKKAFKLTLSKETVRVLSVKELSRAAGGQDTVAAVVPQSRDKQCVAAAITGG
jgi:hypothetical protein